MRVREILQSKSAALEAVDPHEKVQFLASRMRLANVGALLVHDAQGGLAGLVSERDVVRAVVDHGPRALNQSARDIMNRSPATCGPEDTIARVARMMTERRIRHVPVLSDDRRILGIVSVGDIVKHRLEELEIETGVLRDLAKSVA